jgi:hypothetical protein
MSLGQAVRPVKVCCTQFGQKNGLLHFHVFPRTQEITSQYLEENPSERDKTVDGLLLARARRRRLSSMRIRAR